MKKDRDDLSGSRTFEANFNHMDKKRPAFTGKGKVRLQDKEMELKALKKRLKEVEIERDILKKAVSIFSKSDRNYTNL